jgi:hypothetical protein
MCEDLGHPASIMRRSGHLFTCTLNHQLDVQGVQRYALAGRKLHMTPLQVIENPAPGMVKHPFWINPEALAIIQEKFKGRVIVTMDNYFNTIADYPNFMIISGAEVAALKKIGINSAKDILAMAEGRKELEETHRALIERLTPIFNAAQQATG